MKSKKFLMCLLIVSTTFSAVVCGCNFGGNSNDNSNSSGNSGNNGNDNKPATKEMTFNDLVENHQTVAREFYENHLKSTLTAGRETKSESWYLNKSADDDKKVSSASMSFIYNVDDTTRVLRVSRISFSPVSAQDIADSKVTNVNITDYSSNEVFRFDAKDNYNNQDITNALYSATKTTSSLRLYSESETNNIDRIFDIVEMSDKQVSVTNLNVTKGDESKETLLKNLSNRAEYGYRTTTTTTIEGVKINETAYALENLGGSEIKDPNEKDPNKDPNVNPGQEATAAEIIAALDENCKEKIVAANSLFNDTNKISNGQWYVSKDDKGNITEAQYVYNYQYREDLAYYIVNNVQFKTPINVKDLSQDDINNATYQKGFTTSAYNPTTQDEDFTNVMCDKIFGENAGATRFIIEGGISANSILQTEAKAFTLIEINNNGIKQQSIAIKKSSDNNAYLSKLDDKSNYTITKSSEYAISGEKVENQVNEAAPTAYYYAIDFGDDDLIRL